MSAKRRNRAAADAVATKRVSRTRKRIRDSGTADDRRVAATEFKARCLELMDQVHQDRRSIVVTKHGKPIARLVPYEVEPPPIFGFVKEGIAWYGDIVSPTDEAWEADAP